MHETRVLFEDSILTVHAAVHTGTYVSRKTIS